MMMKKMESKKAEKKKEWMKKEKKSKKRKEWKEGGDVFFSLFGWKQLSMEIRRRERGRRNDGERRRRE
jgi:hypothetical protein